MNLVKPRMNILKFLIINILKDLAKRNGNIPGIPEYTFVMYKLNLNDDLFKENKVYISLYALG